MSIIKLLFFLFIGYILFNLLRFVFYLGKGLQEGRKRFSHTNKDKSQENNKDVIELDKDQYKVE